MIGPWAQTYSGGAWSIFHPEASRFDLRDLRALRNICRFGGHVRGFYPYTVAEHSVRVTGIVAEMGATREVQWAALVHDAHLLGPCEHQWDPLPEPHREQVIAMPPNIAWREFVSLFEQLRPASVPSIVDALAGAS